MSYFGSHINFQIDPLSPINSAKKVFNSGGNFVQIFLTTPAHKFTQQTKQQLIEFKNFIE